MNSAGGDSGFIKRYNELGQQFAAICESVASEVVCSKNLVENLVVCMLANEHGFLIGEVGLGQTQIISTLARRLGMSFSRVAMSEDTWSNEIMGNVIQYEDKSTGELRIRIGNCPLHANVVLVDEFERAPKSTQNNLIETMRARAVTLAGQKQPLPHPFTVFGTRTEEPVNGALTHSQFDSFMICEKLEYPNEEDELKQWEYLSAKKGFNITLKPSDFSEAQKIIPQVPITEFDVRYATMLVRATRPESGNDSEFVRQSLLRGAGTRTVGHLITAAKGRAFLRGRTYVQKDDISSLALPILRKRIVTSFSAEAEGLTEDSIVTSILSEFTRANHVTNARNENAGLSTEREER